MLWLTRTVRADEYTRLHRSMCDLLPGVARNVCDASRFWYIPAVRAGHEFRCVSLTGAPLDVDTVLAALPAPSAVAPTTVGRLPTPPVAGRLSASHRAERYLAARGPWHCPHGLVCRGQRCHATLFKVCVDAVRGFALSDDQAFEVIWRWNTRNEPPFPREYVLEQIERARAVGVLEFGHHLRAQIRRAG